MKAHSGRSRWTWGGLVLAAVAAAGCAQAPVNQRPAVELVLQQKHAPFEAFTCGCGDVISVEVEGYPDLDRQVVVAPDGTVSLPLVGDVSVVGLTVAEVREALARRYAAQVPARRIEVTMVENRSARIYVLGQVARPGVQPFLGQQTLLDAIGSAGGVTQRGAPKKILVVRGDPRNPEVYRVNLFDIVNGGRAEENLFLAQNDVVYVPPNGWARVGFAIDNVLFPFSSAGSAATTVLAFDRLANND